MKILKACVHIYFANFVRLFSNRGISVPGFVVMNYVKITSLKEFKSMTK